MKKADIKKWTAALRSGEYSQTIGELNTSEGFCCLGVACKVFIPKSKLEYNGDGFIGGGLPSCQKHAPEWLQNLSVNFYKLTDTRITDLNDLGMKHEDPMIDRVPFSFDEIADILEAVYIHEVLN